jgi:very-short-patch-repair endonuclease
MRDVTEIVRYLRQRQTPAEKVLWEKVRANKLGFKIVRQKPVKYMIDNKLRWYIADFYCEQAKLIIEVDGSIHFIKAESDHYKDFIIFQHGYTVVRYSNMMVFESLDFVLKDIQEKCSTFQTKQF